MSCCLISCCISELQAWRNITTQACLEQGILSLHWVLRIKFRCIYEWMDKIVVEPGPYLVPWSPALHWISIRYSTSTRTAAFLPPALPCPKSELGQHHYPEPALTISNWVSIDTKNLWFILVFFRRKGRILRPKTHIFESLIRSNTSLWSW